MSERTWVARANGWQLWATLAFIALSLLAAGALSYSYLANPYGLVQSRYQRMAGVLPEPRMVALTFLVPLVEAGGVVVLVRPLSRLSSVSFLRACVVYLVWFSIWRLGTPTDLPIVYFWHQVWLGFLFSFLFIAAVIVEHLGLGRSSRTDGKRSDEVV